LFRRAVGTENARKPAAAIIKASMARRMFVPDPLRLS